MRRYLVLARGRGCGCASSTPAHAKGTGCAASVAAAAGAGGYPRGAVCRGVARHAAHQRRADPGGHPAAQGVCQRRRQRAGLHRDHRQERLPLVGAGAGAGHARACHGHRRVGRSVLAIGSRRGCPGRCCVASAGSAPDMAAGAAPGIAGHRHFDARDGDRADDAVAAACSGGKFTGGRGCRERCPCDRQPAAAVPADHRDQWVRDVSNAFAGWFPGCLRRRQ